MNPYRMLVASLAVVIVGASAQGSALAAYPDHPVHLIVPYPPAGGADAAARVMAVALEKQLGQSFVIDNRPGASGRIGTELVAKAVPDGYTLLLGNVGPNAIIPAAYRDLPYDAVDGFAPVGLIGTSAYALVVPASSPAHNVKQLIALAKAKPGALNFASTGNLGGPHLAGEMFKLLAHVDVVHVPYKGGGPMVTALLGGEVAFAFASLPTVTQHVKAGTLRILAVTGERRVESLPDVPTMGELLPGYRVVQWYGILAPAGTPRAQVDSLNAAMVRALNDPGVRDQLARLDTNAAPDSPEQFAGLIKDDIRQYRDLVQRSGIHAE
ncbi:MAG: tripartite tricarboxylate transporter substrate binding protein [Proteobacteria bacterium]|nr:tripartite tricarboxylate transporter substrate binding protein [Pseudomonadota bacterium]